MTIMDPLEALTEIQSVRAGEADAEQLLWALTTLRLLRDELATWEPELITAARTSGTSWAALAPALGVASRQAAERRYLRLQPSVTGETTGEARVDAQRDKRAGDRAVAAWARENSATLRKLAGQVSALGGLGTAAQRSADRLGAALGDDDAAALLAPLNDAQPHLTERHGALADQVTAITERADRLRRDAASLRHDRGK
ncbi:HSP18 transcriptional regulator [Amycolatopsis xylanica]|nr:HSP18 transcriptional regulator [Amycolatopsis xylanica]